MAENSNTKGGTSRRDRIGSLSSTVTEGSGKGNKAGCGFVCGEAGVVEMVS